jgi:Asp-tRNA(Asn)/Glu-tRNA(Gln) amidotransferase A subunit family amidase
MGNKRVKANFEQAEFAVTDNFFLDRSIAEIHKGFKDRTIDPVEIAQMCINRVERLDSTYQAWVCFDKELFLKQAYEIRKRIENGEEIRPLEGIPVGTKDIFNTLEFPTQMGSPLWKGFHAGNDARVVYYIKHAGGIIPGKTVTAEFAVHSLLEKTLNPHNITLTPGTSSSGSAVSIALGMVPVALGTQTGGSVVRPASFCGVYGCKPSFGLIPRTGVLKTNDGLDTIGFFTSKFNDLERVFDVLRVHGPDYPISYNALKDHVRQNKPENRPWRVVLAKTHTWEHAYDYAKKSFLYWSKRLSVNKNIEIIEIDLPEIMQNAHEVHTTIYDKSLSYYFNREFRDSKFISPIMNEIILRGNKISFEKYEQALELQKEMARAMDRFLQHYDAMISLSTAGEAPLREEIEKPDTALMWTMTHLPVITVPVFISPNGLPFGVQLVARKYNDYLLLKFAEYLRSIDLIPEGTNPKIYNS